MDPLPPTLTVPSPWNEVDTPRTRDLKHLRAKRVAYYESIGIIKDDSSRYGSQPVLTASQDTKVSPLENENFGLRCPQKLPSCSASGKSSLLHPASKVNATEAIRPLDQRTQEEHWRKSHLAELDLHMLADALVPETQKLRHVIDWAHKFLSNPPEKHGPTSPASSLGHFRPNLYQSSQDLGSKNNAPLRLFVSPPLLWKDQSSTRADTRSFSPSPQSNLSEMGLSPEFSGSFQEMGFPGNQFCGWQETAVRNVKEGRATDSLKQIESARQKDRTGNKCIQSSSGEEMFPEGLGIPSQLRHAYEESKDLGEAGQSPPRNGYFWTPLVDSSDEEPLDEPRESKGTPTRGAPWRKCKEFWGTALAFTNDSAQMSRTTVLESGVSSSGEPYLEADFRKKFKGAGPVGTPKVTRAKFKADGSRDEGPTIDPIQNLPGSQFMSPCASSKGKGKESDNVGFTLGSPHTDNNHRKEWKLAIPLRVGDTVMDQVPRGSQNIIMLSSAIKIQRQFDPVHYESHLAPQIASLSLSLLEDPLENVSSYVRWDSDVFCEPAADTPGTCSSSMCCSQSPPPGMESRSVQTPQGTTGETIHEQKEETPPLCHPIFRDISHHALKGSLLQEVGGNPSWGGDTPRKPEPGASVLETYFYCLHVLNKIRGLPSKDENSSLPSQGPRLSESEWITTSPEGKGRWKGVKLDRETKEWREGSESHEAVDGEERICPEGQGCGEEAAPQEISFWKPQGSYGRLCSAIPKVTSRMTSCSGYWEMSDTTCSSHVHGEVKPRSQSAARTSSAEAEERAPTEVYPSAYAIGSADRLFRKNVLQGVERENEEHKRDDDFSRWLLLPEEIWICIFSLLSHKELARVAQVCHHFHWLASDESLWKQIRIADCHALKDDWLVALARRHPRALTLHRCRDDIGAVTKDGLKRLFWHCGDFLQELNVTSCSGPGFTGDKVLLHAGALCARLTAVDISWSGATDVGVMGLIDGASSLQRLSVSGCQITDKAIKALVKKHGHSLHKIEVFGCLALTERSVVSLALQCRHLQTLNIGRVPKIPEACLVRSLENLQEVTTLNIAGLKVVSRCEWMPTCDRCRNSCFGKKLPPAQLSGPELYRDKQKRSLFIG
ncbi:uncharacterized protein LOC126083303 isoform X2 [Elephas maximus indicus]|uniref:uncharacterized protein LOC126083303 isoform X2 n=1 Tax=Elephas maximus indicus TaxID=99487 RepID=UPI00211631BF|nr:uncharacterized protein LOC126083303 isoform X2 [Elephas maximus indicus]